MTVQIEQHAEVRAAFATPQEGELPLPKGLPPAMLECNPQAVEDLNAVVPQGAQPLSSQALNEQVSDQATELHDQHTLSHLYSLEWSLVMASPR